MTGSLRALVFKKLVEKLHELNSPLADQKGQGWAKGEMSEGLYGGCKQEEEAVEEEAVAQEEEEERRPCCAGTLGR